MSRKSVFLFAACLILLVGVAVHAPAQTFYGSVVGTVADSSGATIAGATVTLTNTGTAERLSAQTDSKGDYEFLNLLPSMYKVDVEQPGFKHLTRDQIEVRVGNATRVDVSLQVGQVTQSVQVTSQAALLQTDSSDLSEVVEGRQVQDMPLNGRNVFNLVTLVPGVIPMGSTQGSPVDNGGTTTSTSGFGNYSIGGGVLAQNVIFVDGAQDDLSGNNTPLVPTQDSIQEFSVLTNDIPAEYGGFGGGVINMTTKSGTNAFHGTAYEYLRNRVLNANDFFSNRAGLPRPEFTQNQYGATVGGPVKHNRLFFFGSWEGFSLRKQTPTTDTVPTAAEDAGNFAGLNTIYDPLTTCGVNGNAACALNSSGQPVITRQPFPNNQIPVGRFDPTALVMQKYWPAPNESGTVNNYVLNYPHGGNSNQYSGRADYSLNDKQRLFARYTYWQVTNTPSDPFHNLTGDSNYTLTTQQFVLGYTFAIKPTLLLDLRGAWVRENYPVFADSIGINESEFGPAWGTIGSQLEFTKYPGESITGGFIPLTAGAQLNVNTDYFYTGNLTKILGRHTIKAGGQFKRDFVFVNSSGAANTFSFDSTFTSTNATNSSSSGLGFADFILGAPTTGQLGNTKRLYITLNTYAFYVMDTYQVSPRLTLNAGLRWDQPGSDGEKYNSNVVLNLTQADPIGPAAGLPNLTGQLDLVASPQYPSNLEQALHWKDFGPRVGFAWRANNLTVVSGGFGINYLPYLVERYPALAAATNSSVTNMVTTLNSGLTPSATMSNPYPNGLIQPAGRTPGFLQTLEGGTVEGALPSQPAKYAMQWNLSVQRDLRHDMMLQATYAASAGRHLSWGGSGASLDQLPDQYQSMGSALLTQVPNPFYGVLPATVGLLGQKTVAQGYLLRPHPQFLSVLTLAENVGVSGYNALQLTFQKRFKSGSTLGANYTWSKFLTDTEPQTGSGESDISIAGTQDWYNRHADYSLSSANVPQRVVINYVYDLPFGKGEHFFNQRNGVANQLVGGWAVNGVTTFSEGFPLNITSLGNDLSSDFGAGTIRPNVVAGCNTKFAGPAQSRLKGWFNTACFQQPGTFAFGDYNRTSPNLRQAGIANYDFDITKSFAIHEAQSLEFDSQFFNMFNREQFAPPTVQEGNANFGVVTATSLTANPRLIQFAMRFKF